MAVITWQNINGASAAPASDVLTAANQSITSALAGFGNIFKQAESTQLANQQAMRNFNTEDALDTIYQFVKPEDLQNAQRTGAFTDLFAKYGGNFDKTAVRNLLDSRPATLMERDINADNYGENQRIRAEKSVFDGILGDAYQNPEAALRKAESSDLFKKPELLSAIYRIKHDKIAEDRAAADAARAATRDAREKETHARQIKLLDRQDALDEGNLALSKAVIDYQTQEANLYQEYGNRYLNGKPYNPRTATQDEVDSFNLVNKDGKYSLDTEAIVAAATKQLRSQLKPEVFAQLQPTIASRFVTGINPSGEATRKLSESQRFTEAALDEYKRTGFYGGSLGVGGPADLKRAAVKGITEAVTATAGNKWTPWNQLDESEVLATPWMDKKWYLGGNARADLMDIIDSGMLLPDPKTGKKRRFDFPLQEIETAVARLKSGDEQSASTYLRELKTGMESGVYDGSTEAYNARMDGLIELEEYNQKYEKWKKATTSTGEGNLKGASK